MGIYNRSGIGEVHRAAVSQLWAQERVREATGAHVAFKVVGVREDLDGEQKKTGQ